MAIFSNSWLRYRYDDLSRLSERDIADLLTEHRTYLQGASSTNTTGLTKDFYTTAKGNTTKLSGFRYEYDAVGNITKITDLTDGTYTKYIYDKQGQLTLAEEYNSANTLVNTDEYRYDTYGNIRSAVRNGVSHSYTYGNSTWRDKLTAYDGHTISYDNSGNPLSYYNGASYTMTWRNGRQLNSVVTGGKTYSYEYDVNGLRTRKTNSDGGYTEYFIMDGLTVAERKFNASNTEVYTMRYYFDESNSPVGIGIQYPSQADTYWANYYFAKNLQGDIIAIYGSSNGAPSLVATYEYDAWGKPLGIYNASGTAISQTSSSIAAINPFRYRGYRYDADTGFYYLQSRYYDPVIGRFINADGLQFIGATGTFIGYNAYAYCENNPIKYSDETGRFIGTLVGTLVGAATGALLASMNGEDILAGAVSGAVSGAITGLAADIIAITGGTAAVVIVAGAAASVAGSVAGSVVEEAMTEGKFDKKWKKETAMGALWSGAFGALFGYMGGPASSQLGKVAKKGLGTVLANTFCRDFAKKATTSAAEEMLTTAVTEVAKVFVKGCYNMVESLIN